MEDARSEGLRRFQELGGAGRAVIRACRGGFVMAICDWLAPGARGRRRSDIDPRVDPVVAAHKGDREVIKGANEGCVFRI